MSTQTNFKFSSAIIAVVLIVPFVLYWIFGGISYRNQEVVLRNQFNAKMTGNKVDYDAAWKIVSETYHIAQEERETFGTTYAKIVHGTEDTGKAVSGLLLAVGVRPPQVDSSLYRKVQDTIESQRTKFANAQKEVLDVKREHDNLCAQFPGSMFLSGVQPLEVKLVTSTKTEKAFEAGVDDESFIGGKK